MTEALHGLARPALGKLRDALAAGWLQPPYGTASVGEYVPDESAAAVGTALRTLQDAGMSPRHLAVLVGALAAERQAAQEATDRVKLVWSWGDLTASPKRRTDVVVAELFRHAEHRVLVASYGIDPKPAKAQRLFEPLADNMDDNPDLAVRMCVNIRRGRDDSRPDQVLVASFAGKFSTELWPGSRLPELFYDPRSLIIGGATRACLHAKCVVEPERSRQPPGLQRLQPDHLCRCDIMRKRHCPSGGRPAPGDTSGGPPLDRHRPAGGRIAIRILRSAVPTLPSGTASACPGAAGRRGCRSAR